MTAREATPALTLTPEVFAILAGLVEERTGLHHEARDLTLFASKTLARVAEAGFQSALDYYYFLRYDASSAAEFDALVDALVVNETYFFREPTRCAWSSPTCCARSSRPAARPGSGAPRARRAKSRSRSR